MKRLSLYILILTAIPACGAKNHKTAVQAQDLSSASANSLEATAAEQEPKNLVASSERFEYQFKDSSCNTFKRVALDREQLCRNLQYPEQNNGCAMKDRKELFDKVCFDKKWEPSAALNRGAVNGVTCYLTEEGKAKAYTSSQVVIDTNTEIFHDFFHARIQYENAGASIKVWLLRNSDDEVLGYGEKQWTKGDTSSLQLKAWPYKLACWH